VLNRAISLTYGDFVNATFYALRYENNIKLKFVFAFCNWNINNLSSNSTEFE